MSTLLVRARMCLCRGTCVGSSDRKDLSIVILIPVPGGVGVSARQ